jgi:glycosyltransferase involved in cell wall biosynthesis
MSILSFDVIGNFSSARANGQTEKTLNVSRALEKAFPTAAIRRLESRRVFRTIVALLLNRGSIVVCLFGSRSLYLYTPIIFLLNKITRRKFSMMHNYVVGGWIADFLRDKKFFLRIYSRVFDLSLVEADGLVDALELLGVRAQRLNNFRDISGCVEKRDFCSPYKFCFVSRVRVDKGILKVIELSERNPSWLFDVYGPIEDDTVKQELRKNRKNLRYRGSVDNRYITEVLREYHFLVLPTFYEGECQPGVLIEAFSQGVPCITSNWKFLTEFNGNSTGATFGLEQFVLDFEAFIASMDARSYIGKSRAARLEYTQRYDINYAVGEFQRIYGTCLSSSGNLLSRY